MAQPTMQNDRLTVKGDSRLFLVQDFNQSRWDDHKYVRLDLQQASLRFTVDVSNVPCGCLAMVYLVKMKDPAGGTPQYCDMSGGKLGMDDEVRHR